MIHPLAYVEDASLGDGVVIRQFASVTGGTVLGDGCSVSPFAMLHGPVFGKRCRISCGVAMGPGFLVGDDVFVGPNVTFCNDMWPRTHKEGLDFSKFDGARWAIIVEDGVGIGAGAVILPGVRIGKGALVSAGTRVTNDIPAGHIWLADVGPRLIRSEGERMRFVRALEHAL